MAVGKCTGTQVTRALFDSLVAGLKLPQAATARPNMVSPSIPSYPDIASDTSDARNACDSVQPCACAKPKVLCVDDEPLILAGLRFQLRSDCRVLGADDGPSALDKLRTERDICVVISDLRMKTMDGITFLSEVRAIAPRVVTMLITGARHDASLKETAARVGVHRLLLKPCSKEELRDAIREGVETYRSARDD